MKEFMDRELLKHLENKLNPEIITQLDVYSSQTLIGKYIKDFKMGSIYPNKEKQRIYLLSECLGIINQTKTFWKSCVEIFSSLKSANDYNNILIIEKQKNLEVVLNNLTNLNQDRNINNIKLPENYQIEYNDFTFKDIHCNNEIS